jgi:pimeloyl-ACP methyl ester carboxylesterase
MKKLMLLLGMLPYLTQGQDITGKWNGMLRVQGMELRLVFHISMSDSTYDAKMDSPDQKAFGIQASATSFKDPTLNIEITKLGVRYQGQYRPNGIEGFFYQAGQSLPLNLTRNPIEKKTLFRPQEPKEPYPHYSEEVSFSSEGGKIVLAGTLTLPMGNDKSPAAILISGSGPQNRDEEFMTHKPFLVLADHLTKMGIAVLRYDDRGFGQSTGKHGSATSADFANDVRAAIAYLETRKEIDKNRIGLVGHSEGGLIAPIVAADTKVAFVVLLAAPGVPGSQVLLKQVELAARSKGVDEESIQRELKTSRGVLELFSQHGEEESFETRLKEHLKDVVSDTKVIPQGMTEEEFIKMQVSSFRRPWLRYFLKYDPATSLKSIKCPVLALNGRKDLQVAPENLAFIEKAIRQGGNDKVTVKEFADMNHLFQTCQTGAMDEYATIEQTIDPSVLEEISGWILKQTR